MPNCDCETSFLTKAEYQNPSKFYNALAKKVVDGEAVLSPLILLDYDSKSIRTFYGYPLKGMVRFATSEWFSLIVPSQCDVPPGAIKSSSSLGIEPTLNIGGPVRYGYLQVIDVETGCMIREYRIQQNGDPAYYQAMPEAPSSEDQLKACQQRSALLEKELSEAQAAMAALLMG